jgi:hypothetical protein
MIKWLKKILEWSEWIYDFIVEDLDMITKFSWGFGLFRVWYCRIDSECLDLLKMKAEKNMFENYHIYPLCKSRQRRIQQVIENLIVNS